MHELEIVQWLAIDMRKAGSIGGDAVNILFTNDMIGAFWLKCFRRSTYRVSSCIALQRRSGNAVACLGWDSCQKGDTESIKVRTIFDCVGSYIADDVST